MVQGKHQIRRRADLKALNADLRRKTVGSQGG